MPQAARKRWINLPDVPFPTSDINAHPKVGVFINLDWKDALLSLVQHADQPRFWDGGDPDTIETQAYSLYHLIRIATGMIGALVPYATETPPPGTLPCDASEYRRADYPALYAALPPSYKFTSSAPETLGEDMFRTPDFRGRFVLAAQTSVYEPASEGGESEHTLTLEEMPEHAHDNPPHTHETVPHSHSNPPHTHGYYLPTFNIDVESVGVPDPTGVGNPALPATTSPNVIDIGFTTVQVDPTTITIEPTGGGQPHNNMPPYIAFNYAIVAY